MIEAWPKYLEYIDSRRVDNTAVAQRLRQLQRDFQLFIEDAKFFVETLSPLSVLTKQFQGQRYAVNALIIPQYLELKFAIESAYQHIKSVEHADPSMRNKARLALVVELQTSLSVRLDDVLTDARLVAATRLDLRVFFFFFFFFFYN